jgi:hypothetical protein
LSLIPKPRTRKTAARRRSEPDADFRATFAALRDLLARYEANLVVAADDARQYMLDTKGKTPAGRSLCFGGVRLGKAYVSYYLMPVYIFPDLLDGIPSDLASRMQGKSCFNFQLLEPAQQKALAALTKRGFERYRKNRMLRPGEWKGCPPEVRET